MTLFSEAFALPTRTEGLASSVLDYRNRLEQDSQEIRGPLGMGVFKLKRILTKKTIMGHSRNLGRYVSSMAVTNPITKPQRMETSQKTGTLSHFQDIQSEQEISGKEGRGLMVKKIPSLEISTDSVNS